MIVGIDCFIFPDVSTMKPDDWMPENNKTLAKIAAGRSICQITVRSCAGCGCTWLQGLQAAALILFCYFIVSINCAMRYFEFETTARSLHRRCSHSMVNKLQHDLFCIKGIEVRFTTRRCHQCAAILLQQHVYFDIAVKRQPP
jgi:hypothetical protein